MDYFSIGNVKIEKSAALAPMASVADRAFRLMCREYGAAYVVGEMASAKGLFYSDKKTAELLTVTPAERPMAVQLFGGEAEYIAKAIKIAEQYKPDIIDINSGCPVPKVVSGGAGSALLKSPKTFAEVVTAAVKATDIPVTVKIRKGWDDNSVNALEIAKIAQECGAAAITVHGRTRTQMYSGKADWDIIAQIKQELSIPVIGNGDVDSPEKCLEMYKYTGCDLVMIGRGAYGKPWLFGHIRHYLETGELLPEPTLAQRLEIMTKHIELLCKDKGEYIGMKEARKHTGWYLKGIKKAAIYRNYCGTLSTLDDFYKMTEQIKKENEIE